jgi:hypothetical protein
MGESRGRIHFTPGELGEDRAPPQPDVLALGDAPCVEDLAARQLEALKELAGGSCGVSELAKPCLGRPGPHQVAQQPPVHDIVPEYELDRLPIGPDEAGRLSAERAPQPAQAPPEGAAGIVRHVPEEFAEPVPAHGPAGDREVAEQGAGLARSRQRARGAIHGQPHRPDQAQLVPAFLLDPHEWKLTGFA